MALLGPLKCPECGELMDTSDYVYTLVGYYSPPGHDHDDNCLRINARCPKGHTARPNPRRKCPAEGCDWMGKLTCFCHQDEKRGIWLNDDPE